MSFITQLYYYVLLILYTKRKKKQEATEKEEEEIQFKNRQQASHRLYNRQI